MPTSALLLGIEMEAFPEEVKSHTGALPDYDFCYPPSLTAGSHHPPAPGVHRNKL